MIEFSAIRQRPVTNVLRPVRVHVHWSVKVFFAIGTIWSLFVSYDAWRDSEPIASVTSGAFALLVIWAFFLAGSTIDADEQGVRVTAPHGVYELRWNELESFELRSGSTYLFGNDKVLAYNLLLAGRGKRELQEYVARSIRELHIAPGKPANTNVLTLRRMRRNAKVRGWKLF
jgi:hypothetical protein